MVIIIHHVLVLALPEAPHKSTYGFVVRHHRIWCHGLDHREEILIQSFVLRVERPLHGRQRPCQRNFNCLRANVVEHFGHQGRVEIQDMREVRI